MKKNWLMVGVILFVLAIHTILDSALVFLVTVPSLKRFAFLSSLYAAGVECSFLGGRAEGVSLELL
jgi:hypothetical protein